MNLTNYIVVCLLFLTFSKVYSDEILIGYDHISTINSADFKEFPGSPTCCPQFGEGYGYGYNLKIEYIVDIIYLEKMKFGFSISNINSVISSYEMQYVSDGTNLFMGKIQHRVEVDYKSYNLSIYKRINLIDNLNLDLGISESIIPQIHFDQIEKLVEPRDRGYFPDTKTRTRHHEYGLLNNYNKNQIVFQGDLSYKLKMNKSIKLFFVPFFNYYYYIQSYFDNSKWNTYGYKFGLNLCYQF